MEWSSSGGASDGVRLVNPVCPVDIPGILMTGSALLQDIRLQALFGNPPGSAYAETAQRAGIQ